jgi:hypothetical protein
MLTAVFDVKRFPMVKNRKGGSILNGNGSNIW